MEHPEIEITPPLVGQTGPIIPPTLEFSSPRATLQEEEADDMLLSQMIDSFLETAEGTELMNSMITTWLTDLPKIKERPESALVTLTQNLVRLMMQHKGPITRNEALSALDVKSRRLYEVTNGLEGLGLLQTNQGKLEWHGPDMTMTDDEKERMAELEKELSALELENSVLEDKIAQSNTKYAKMVKDPAISITSDELIEMDIMSGYRLITAQCGIETDITVPEQGSYLDGNTNELPYYMELRSNSEIVVMDITSRPSAEDAEGETVPNSPFYSKNGVGRHKYNNFVTPDDFKLLELF
ncbi:hypothetical protein PCE1_003320 [Barthelona sp. PCE]